MHFFLHKFDRIRERIAEGNFSSARRRVDDLLREGLSMKSRMACLLEKTGTFQHNLAVLADALKNAENTSDAKEKEKSITQAMSILNSFPKQLESIKLAARKVIEQEKQIEEKA
ncbi:hypothetical protein HZB90_01065 [archaeon]|nr:hypothetical protein [archaeon]